MQQFSALVGQFGQPAGKGHAACPRRLTVVQRSLQRVDALDELSRRGLLDVLGDRHQLAAVAAQGGADRDVILDVSRQAIDLLNDNGPMSLCATRASIALRWGGRMTAPTRARR
jgi:hypothetical protein